MAGGTVSGKILDNELENEQVALEGHDLNRITPKGFLRLDKARRALVKELIGLTTPSNTGMPAMSIVYGYSAQFRQLQKAHSMVAMRKKTVYLYKARLVSRGDMVSGDQVAFSSAPTTGRGIMRTVVCVCQLSNLTMGSIDVTGVSPI